MTTHSLTELALQMKTGQKSCAELLEPHLARIEEREPNVRAWTWFEAPRARRIAEQLDAIPVSERRGELYGVPIGIKDIFATVDMPTEYGSPIYQGHQPDFDATCVALLRQAGAIILGKTVTTEFAASNPGPTTNPHDAQRTPGGSSSGSAAAVADKMVSAALGSQTAGSVIRPAAFCGVVGFKPTFNSINRRGMNPLSEFTDTIGVFTQTVTDAAELVSVLARRSMVGADFDRPARIGICETPEWQDAEPDMREALQQTATDLAAAGAEVEPLVLPQSCTNLYAVGRTILSVEASLAFTHEYNAHRSELGANTRTLIETGLATTAEAYESARDVAVAARQAVAEQLTVGGDAGVDAILTPSAAGAAPIGLTSTGSPAFNHIWTLLHLPCVTLPAATSSEGMPLGLQLVGAPGCDRQLLAIAKWAEDALGL